MMPFHKTTDTASSDCSAGTDGVLATMLGRLCAPLARLCLANGVTFATVVEILKCAFVREASKLQLNLPNQGAVSRISTATGINRREVTRLTKTYDYERRIKPPIATELFARWTTAPELRDQSGDPCVLKRLGPAPSFEALAHSITRDVHPGSLLGELIRLGIAHFDEETDCVTLCRGGFVPSGDSMQLLGFLSANVGDHLDAAVANVLHDDCRHLEQAVFADELSTESIEILNPLIKAHWKSLHDDIIPTITALIEADRLAGRSQDQRVRIGMYTFSEPTSNAEAAKLNQRNAGRKPTIKE